MTYVFLGCNSQMKKTCDLNCLIRINKISLILDGKKPSLFLGNNHSKTATVRGTEHISFRIVAKGAHEQLPLGAK